MILCFGGDSDMAKSIKDAVLIPHEECDVKDPLSVDWSLKEYKPNVVINFAGISNIQPVKESDPFKWKDEIETNLIGSYNVAKACTENDVGTMIFIASVAGLYGKANHSGYSASKAGVISLVQSLGQEGYNAYAISPGRVNTKLRQKDYPNEDPRTRLKTSQIVDIITDIINGKYEPGDNVVIRMRKFETLPIEIDKHAYWERKLRIGLPLKY